MQESTSAPRAVFVDPSGRRGRLVARTCWVLGALGALYVALVVVSLFLPPGLSRLAVPGLGQVLPGPGAAPLGTVQGEPQRPDRLLAPASASPSPTPSRPSPRPRPTATAAVAPAAPVPSRTAPPRSTSAPTAPPRAVPTQAPGRPSTAPTRRSTQAPAAPPGQQPTRTPKPRPSTTRGPR